MSLQISWSLHIFCRVCCFAHVSHNGSGSSHVLQKCVAFKWIFSKEHGPHSLSFLCCSNILKSNKNTTSIVFSLHVSVPFLCDYLNFAVFDFTAGSKINNTQYKFIDYLAGHGNQRRQVYRLNIIWACSVQSFILSAGGKK